jgi:hypothetical protein
MRRLTCEGWTAAVPAAVAALVVAARVAAQAPLYTIALSGQQAPGMPPGVHYSLLPAPPVVAWPGMVAYWGVLEGPAVTPATSTGLFRGTANGPRLLARSGTPAPGTGANYLSLGNPGVGPFGVFVYPADLTGPGVTPGNDQALFVAQHRSSTPTVYARTGDPAPLFSPGPTYASLAQPSISGDRVAFYGTVTGPGVTDANNDVIFSGPSLGAPRQFVREGQESKAGPGVNYGMLFQPLVNGSGTVMFGATLTGT